MVILLCILAIAMIATGLLAMAFGMSIVQVERGWTMVISGTVGASAGAVLLGVALAAHRLGRIAHEMIWIRDRLATIGEMTAAEAANWVPQEEVEAAAPGYEREATGSAEYAPPYREQADSPPPQAPIQPPAPVAAPPAERVVVGQYASGGNDYKMFSDGSIDAMTPAGLRRFASLEELRIFVAGGGERPQ